MDLPIVLSQANCATRVLSRNQRRIRTACLNGLSARLSLRVPRRRRSPSSKFDRNSTVWSRTGNVAVYVTLIRTRNLDEVDLGRTTFIPGFRVVALQHNTFGAPPTIATQRHRRLPGKAHYAAAGSHGMSCDRYSPKLASTTRLPVEKRWSDQVPCFGNPARKPCKPSMISPPAEGGEDRRWQPHPFGSLLPRSWPEPQARHQHRQHRTARQRLRPPGRRPGTAAMCFIQGQTQTGTTLT